MVEPTKEFQYRFLTTLQKSVGATYTDAELKIVKTLFDQRRQFGASKQAQLDQASTALANLDLATACGILGCTVPVHMGAAGTTGSAGTSGAAGTGSTGAAGSKPGPGTAGTSGAAGASSAGGAPGGAGSPAGAAGGAPPGQGGAPGSAGAGSGGAQGHGGCSVRGVGSPDFSASVIVGAAFALTAWRRRRFNQWESAGHRRAWVRVRPGKPTASRSASCWGRARSRASTSAPR
jgi:hypothetical protein